MSSTKGCCFDLSGVNLITDFAQRSKLTLRLLLNRIVMYSCEPRVYIFFLSVSLCCKERNESQRMFSLLPCFFNLWLLKTPCVAFLLVDFAMIFCGFFYPQGYYIYHWYIFIHDYIYIFLVYLMTQLYTQLSGSKSIIWRFVNVSKT